MGVFGKFFSRFKNTQRDSFTKAKKEIKRAGGLFTSKALSGLSDKAISEANSKVIEMWKTNARMGKQTYKPTSKEIDKALKEPNVNRETQTDFYNSRAIKDAIYEPTTQNVFIRFQGKNPKLYAYPNVDKEEIVDWVRAGSKGKYYWHAGIKDKAVSGYRAVPDYQTSHITLHSQLNGKKDL